MKTISSEEPTSFREAFESDSGLERFGSNSLSIFALSLYLRLEDPDEFAASSITEGPNDKKLDICYLNEDEGRLILVQSYISENWGREAAPANKASDLITAVGWLFSASEDLIPPHLQTKALEIRCAIEGGSIDRVEILFIHNCPESTNVKSELQTAADTARDITRALRGDQEKDVVISFREMGINVIEEA